jgi:hypothetical protein
MGDKNATSKQIKDAANSRYAKIDAIDTVCNIVKRTYKVENVFYLTDVAQIIKVSDELTSLIEKGGGDTKELKNQRSYVNKYRDFLKYCADQKEKVDDTSAEYNFADDPDKPFISEEKFNEIVELLFRKKNIILQGAPGVGKTFLARKIAYQNKDRIAKTLRRMPQTRRIRITDNTLNSVRLHRNNRYYHFALNVCKLLHQAALPNESVVGNQTFLDMMDDERLMNRIFEKFLMNFYKQECRQDFPEVSRSHIRFQLTPYGMTFAKSTDEAYALLPVMETDVTLYNPQTKKKIILDAKYYKDTLASRYGEKGKIRRDHLSQILTYVMNQENDTQPHTKDTRGILVYPTVDTELDVSYVYKNTSHIIRVSTVNLNQDWRMIEKRLKEIICN